MPQQENNNHYSEQTKELLGRLPSWIVRWGLLVIFFIFAGIIVGSCLIKYPQIVTAPITITTINPPSDMIAKSTGRIDTIFAKDGAIVHIDDNVALLYNTASYDDVTFVNRAISWFNIDSIMQSDWLNQDFRMGEIQGTFSEFRRLCSDYKHYIQAKNIPRKKNLIAAQIAKHRKYLNQLKSQRALIVEDMNYSHKNYQRDSALYAQNVISALDFERSAQAKLQKRNALESFSSSMTSTELTILQLDQQIFELDMQYENEVASYRTQINESVGRLAAQIKQWQQSYLLTSPIEGKLSFTKYWSANQNVQTGEKIGTVVPKDATQVIGIMKVPSAGFGRVEVGQKVNVKLSGYPYMEYGMLKGTITRLSSIPDSEMTASGIANGYIAEVTFPTGLQSTYKEHLKLIQQMDGTGDIITKDQRLIQRFIQPIRALFDKVTN